ncbi:transglycosylase domain-containing protein [Pseudobacter ginsenosidimutans]|uniref:Penicillin-binding protein 1A n=1 Tax=Pseudobacter ginsenosidimutans TaxID=661488 RepID=A0A4Q7MZX7_9BACT|nr:transglycosylase domain-containing protein [Pseudobacter ginsenosidimutans]QEC43470.1 penicillin-binding protein [Pseudobacter ginsenosidimutans]RZS74857.1 penicillin-binding protein 1A [Pseudobacter ginsenosidimutans]
MTRAVRIFWRIFIYGALAVVLLLVLINFGAFGKMPSLAQLENPSITLATEVFADDGTPMGKYYVERGNRSYVKFGDISKNVIDALVATEDERFYDHSGIDGRSLSRAILKLGRDGGGSTITQQLALNMFDSRSSNIFLRIIQKIKENIIAIKLERNFTKQEILALYLNTVSFSDNVYGIRNASRTFFSKEPDRLTVPEAAVLIGMQKATATYNPRTNYKAAFDRRNTVIDQMVRNDYVTAPVAANFKKEPIKLNYKKMNENNGIAPYFLDVLRNDLKAWCKENKKEDGEPYDLYADGLKVYTTINPRMQLYAEEAVAKHLPVLQRVLSAQRNIKTDAVWKGKEKVLDAAMKSSDRYQSLKADKVSDDEIKKIFNTKVPMKVFAWNPKREKDTVMSPMDSIKYHHEMMQTAFMVTDPQNGQVKAWVGGIDFKNYKYDHANLKTKRQVGSSIKPYLYALAVEEYGFTPETQCEATQQYFPGFGYVPAKNRGKTGTRTMASGLAWSVNEVAAYIIKQTTPQRFAEFLKQINIPTKVDPYPSIALGSSDLSLFEMMWGYSMFPTGGFSAKPVYITRIEDKNGHVLARFDTERKEVISQATAYTMTRMMQGVVDYGTAAGLRSRLGVAEMGGKTGTTNENSDAWFMGFTPQLLAGVWIGCDDRFIKLESGLGEGGQAARPIWEYFFQKAFADKTLGLDKTAKFVQPENMKTESFYDYYNIIDRTPPPGAEGENVGNGGADDFLGTPDTQNIPTESKQAMEEQKVLQEALNSKNQVPTGKKDSTKTTPKEDKKKPGLFKRIFGGKKDQ